MNESELEWKALTAALQGTLLTNVHILLCGDTLFDRIAHEEHIEGRSVVRHSTAEAMRGFLPREDPRIFLIDTRDVSDYARMVLAAKWWYYGPEHSQTQGKLAFLKRHYEDRFLEGFKIAFFELDLTNHQSLRYHLESSRP